MEGQPCLRELAFGDVILDPYEVGEITAFVAHRGDAQFLPEEGAVITVVAHEHPAIPLLPIAFRTSSRAG